LPGIGESLAKKIWEIIDTGGLEKLEDFQSSEYIRAINLFGNIWGCGPTSAKQWYDQVRSSLASIPSLFVDTQGYRTLDDVRQRAKLSENQQVGLKYYDEFLERIPRVEVTEIETIVSRST
jgi:DNA polymerase lambda